MEKLPKYTHENGIDYVLVGDYYMSWATTPARLPPSSHGHFMKMPTGAVTITGATTSRTKRPPSVTSPTGRQSTATSSAWRNGGRTASGRGLGITAITPPSGRWT